MFAATNLNEYNTTAVSDQEFGDMQANLGLCTVCFEFQTLNACPCGGGAICSDQCYYLYWENSHKAYCTVAARRRVVREVLRPLLPKVLVAKINDTVGR